MNILKNILLVVAIFVFAAFSKAENAEQNETVAQTPNESIKVHSDMRFGKVVRVQGNVATVQIISKIHPSQIEPKILVCDVKLNPVAELESMRAGFGDCFLFKIVRGKAEKGDNVIVRYYKLSKN